jgi:hypothetical protein
VNSLLAFAAVLVQSALPASDSGPSLRGQVHLLGTNQPIAGAQVVAASPSEIREGRTDMSGRFEFSGLQEGRYVVTLQLDGYGVGGVLGGVTAPGEIDYLVVPETSEEM